MAVIGTFGSFTAARLGIYVSQASLNVTGNNISNINTKGYTRQRADLVSLHSAGSARIASSFNLDIGYGVLVDTVSQLRDPFLDIRYRDEQASVGFYEAQLKGLQQISNVLDEVGKGTEDFGVLEAYFNDFLKQLQNLNNRVNSQEYDTTVRSSAESLVKLFNTYSKALDRVKENQLADLQGDVKTVNTTLTKIRELNVQIRNAGIYGEKALELRDQRNVLIDELSSYMKIEVQYSMEPIDEFSSVEKLSITLADSGNPPVYLINGIYGTQLSMPETTAARNPEYDPSLPTSNQYISRYSDLKATPPQIVYTTLEREAMRDSTGALATNDAAGAAVLQGIAAKLDPPVTLPDISANYYDAGLTTTGKYLLYDADGNVIGRTNDPDDNWGGGSTQVDNAVKGSDNNHLWMQLAPLVDEKGRYIQDEYGQDITEVVDLGDNSLFGSLQAKRELLTEEGEYASEEDLRFDVDANSKRGIPYYQRALDSLARKFAESFNAANTTDDGKPLLLGYETEVKNGVEQYKTQDICALGTITTHTTKDGKTVDLTNYQEQQKWVDLSSLPADVQTAIKELQEEHLSSSADVEGALGHGYPITGGGILFSNNGDTDDPKGITAANISISNSWATGSVRLLSSKKYNILENTTANDNIYHMIELMTEQMEYKPDDISDLVNAANGDKSYFKGSFQQRLADINTILGSAQEKTYIQYCSFESTSLNLDNQRQSVSGVDLNEEATNMMMFQKSYSAACQLMTPLDSMLDKLINGTIR